MLKAFFRNFKKSPKLVAPTDTKSAPEDTGWHTPKTAPELLNTPLRQQYLATIWQNVSMTPKMFDTLYRAPIEKYAEMVQPYLLQNLITILILVECLIMG